MNLPDTLAGRLRLLAFQPDSGRPAGYLDLDFALHAAALTDLLLRGLLVDRIGLAERRGAVSARLAPELQGILCGSALAQRQSARWDVLIERPAGTTAIGRAIDERLREGGFVRFAEDRGAGRFPRCGRSCATRRRGSSWPARSRRRSPGRSTTSSRGRPPWWCWPRSAGSAPR